MPAGGDGDLAEIRRLTGIADTIEAARYPAALPRGRGLVAGQPPPRSWSRRSPHRPGTGTDVPTVLVEGAGGLLVRYDDDGATIASLAYDVGAQLVVVTEPASAR